MDSYKGQSSKTSSVFPDENPVNIQIKNLQIIRMAMILSPMIFLVVALVINQGDLEFGIDIMEILALGMMSSALVAYFLMDKFYSIKNLDTVRGLPADELESVLAMQLVSLEIIKTALLEGATFFGIILIIIDNSLVGLMLAVLLILVSIATFPTSTRFLQKLESLRFRVGL